MVSVQRTNTGDSTLSKDSKTMTSFKTFVLIWFGNQHMAEWLISWYIAQLI